MSHILIVGAGDYVGAAIARRFAQGGWTVSMGRRRGEALAPLVEDINQAGGKAFGHSMDARDEASVQNVFAKAEAVAPLDVVIFNVGGNVRFPIRDTTARVFRKVWEMACFGGFLTGRAAATAMVPRGTGCIFFTGATASMRGGNGFSAFASAKAGLRNLAQSMARELGPQGIHVAHVVIDAAIDTEWVREILARRGVDAAALEADTLMNPASVAETYWALAHQPRDAWTFEMDIRPYKETW
ncbi:SDR family NAD(P)-dependent oxidoreductase [Tateyamaria pelophila]|uniref:SDR family NAD(P)-dependent oxidoreductase n=1 Tax=Tateyamaria pelophila TaxID=328415 RepID=UPI001CC0ED0C|nr:SDR family NAD(P)-dependent oxidoreductase [Tateyamaria pelophila]